MGDREEADQGTPKLSVGRIVGAAISRRCRGAWGVIHAARRRQAGIGTMSLYTYVPGKAELIDVMLDTVLGEVAESGDVEPGWRAGLEKIARDNWALYHRHPWMLQVAVTSRPPLGPNVIAKYDRELRAVDGIGLTEVEMDSVLALVLEHVQARRGVRWRWPRRRSAPARPTMSGGWQTNRSWRGLRSRSRRG